MSTNSVTQSSNEQVFALRPRARAIVFGGLAVGVSDFLDATIFYGTWYHITPSRVFQSVAAGLIGRKRAINGGMKTALLGLGLHFLVATIMAAVYYLASLVLPTLLRQALIWGPIFGVAAYFVMTYVVVPMSAISPRTAPIPWPVFLNGIIGHFFLVGLPIALIARYSTKRER